ncbi:MAG TPA: alcohol dehydrogenase catalytic domain-containing protein [Gaiellaceae bacterium]|nr:alcohol dehydrogenase catalytic domain-containing protein [Gaiellaceae bacterium]
MRVKMQVSGVNPTDWKARRGGRAGAEPPFPELVPNQDGAGTIDAVGDGVAESRVGERVWLWEAAWQRAHGTAQEFVVIRAVKQCDCHMQRRWTLERVSASPL